MLLGLDLCQLRGTLSQRQPSALVPKSTKIQLRHGSFAPADIDATIAGQSVLIPSGASVVVPEGVTDATGVLMEAPSATALRKVMQTKQAAPSLDESFELLYSYGKQLVWVLFVASIILLVCRGSLEYRAVTVGSS